MIEEMTSDIVDFQFVEIDNTPNPIHSQGRSETTAVMRGYPSVHSECELENFSL